MEIIYYTKETAPHVPVAALLGKKHGYNDRDWNKNHLHVQSLTHDQFKEYMEHKGGQSIYWPPCAACDWDLVQESPDLKKGRAEIKQRVRLFMAKGKLPSGWMPPTTIRFGGAGLSDAQCSRVVLPGGAMKYYSEKELRSGKAYTPPPGLTDVLEKTVGKYLLAMGCTKKGKTFGKAPYRGGRAPEYILWSCGCETTEEWERSIVVCDRHKRALEGRDE